MAPIISTFGSGSARSFGLSAAANKIPIGFPFLVSWTSGRRGSTGVVLDPFNDRYHTFSVENSNDLALIDQVNGNLVFDNGGSGLDILEYSPSSGFYSGSSTVNYNSPSIEAGYNGGSGAMLDDRIWVADGSSGGTYPLITGVKGIPGTETGGNYIGPEESSAQMGKWLFVQDYNVSHAFVLRSDGSYIHKGSINSSNTARAVASPKDNGVGIIDADEVKIWDYDSENLITNDTNSYFSLPNEDTYGVPVFILNALEPADYFPGLAGRRDKYEAVSGASYEKNDARYFSSGTTGSSGINIPNFWRGAAYNPETKEIRLIGTLDKDNTTAYYGVFNGSGITGNAFSGNPNVYVSNRGFGYALMSHKTING